MMSDTKDTPTLAPTSNHISVTAVSAEMFVVHMFGFLRTYERARLHHLYSHSAKCVFRNSIGASVVNVFWK